MDVKILHGPHTGEVRNLSNDVALEMIRLGRVGRAHGDPLPITAARAAETLAPAAAPGKLAKKKKKTA